MVNEELLHFVWQHQFFNRKDLKTQDGQPLLIKRAGTLNRHSGPDFFNGQIRIGSILWVGNIEIHCRSSDWIAHRHQLDPAYQKVILHVVWEHDREIYLASGQKLSVLELKGLIKKQLIEKYQELQKSKAEIPCEKYLPELEPIYPLNMLDRCLLERVESKSDRISQILQQNQNDWESTFYQLLSKYFGFKVNAIPFELLAIQTPYSLVRKYCGRERSMQALFFGQAGLLQTGKGDEYYLSLKSEYEHLKRLHKLQAIDPSLWKFMRLRPSNFPTIRIAQLASFFASLSRPFIAICQMEKIEEMKKPFRFNIPEYWRSHSKFNTPIKRLRRGTLGEASIDAIIINVIVPILFSWNRSHSLKDDVKLLELLKEVKSENNRIVRSWEKKGLMAESAFDSQALIELKQSYCEEKKCLNCIIGSAMLKKQKAE